ncbi:MAG: adenosylhomocysteinase, partial [Candidatus Lokiarchaeota archaeon]|nr:adenosylhomocysteinase [Candidatus Lokiarchaeota archaeon]
MVKYKVADESLAEKGKEALYIAERKMPVVAKVIRERFEKEKPLKGVTIAGCLHITKETGILARTLMA